MLESAIFWSLLILISAFLLRKFYFSASAEKITRLRCAVIVTDLIALALFYFPWLPLPEKFGSVSGFKLLAWMNFDVVAVFALLFLTTIFVVLNHPRLMRVGAVLHIATSV